MGTEKRARQKAGTQARRAAAQEAAARAKKRRTIIRVGVIALAVIGVFLGITLSGRDDEAEQVAPPAPPVGAEVVAESDDAQSEAGDDGTEEPGGEMTAAEGADDPAEGSAADAAVSDGEPDHAEDIAATDEGQDSGTTDDASAAPEADPTGGPDYTPYAAADYGTQTCAPTGGTAEPVLDFAGAPELCIDTSAPHTAVFDTSRGIVRVALDVTNTPGTSNSFVNLALSGYYDGTLVHRSDPSIGILQGGSPHTNTAADPGPGYTLWDEGTGFTYRPGQLVMARRAAPNSAGAQYFFTVTTDAALLDGQGTYVVFGEVLEGLDVLEDILASHVHDPSSGLGGAPDPPVVVESVTIDVG